MKTQPADVPHRGAGPPPASTPAGAGARPRCRCARTASRRPPATLPPEARQLVRRRVADEAGEVVLDVPAQVVDQPVDVGGELRVAGDLDARPVAGQRAAPAPAPGSRRRRATRRSGVVGQLVAAPFEQAGRRDAERERRQGRQQGRPAVERAAAGCARRARAAAAAATGSAAITWLASRVTRSIDRRRASACKVCSIHGL